MATSVISGARTDTGRGLLRVLACGSAEDGTSTLIGRLLDDTDRIPDDRLQALLVEARLAGGAGAGLDFSLFVDSPLAGHAQDFTSDVAYRGFATPRRRLIVADTPGDERSARNIALGAATADVAVILVDARKGVLTETRRHSYIVSLFGIRHVILAVNKMDLVGYAQTAMDTIRDDYLDIAGELGFESIDCVPVSALQGDNVSVRSKSMPWYAGPTLLEHLETLEVEGEREVAPFRLPVQSIGRPSTDVRAYSGTVVGGRVRPGDSVVISPSGRTSRVVRIGSSDGNIEEAARGQAVTLTLADEVDIGRGDIVAAADSPPEVTDQFRCHILWMDSAPLLPGRSYELRLGGQTTTAAISDLRYSVNVDTLEHVAARSLRRNEIGACNVSLDRAVAYDPHTANRETGSFILIDRYSRHTVGAGVIEFGLRRATNLSWQELQVDKEAHARMKGQTPCVVWFTGLSGAGKSTIADLTEKRLHALGRHTYILDGDNVRHGLSRDLGFTNADRVENVRRVAEVAKLFVDAGLIVLVSFISPFRSERQMARELLEDGEFFEIFVDTPFEVCETRDPKGLYRKARQGAIANFTGIDSPYEAPLQPDLRLPTADLTADAAADRVVAYLRECGIL